MNLSQLAFATNSNHTVCLRLATGFRPRHGMAAAYGILLVGSLLYGSAKATTIELGFDSLPSAQGWVYQGPSPESSVFSVSGGILTMDGRGLGDTLAGYTKSIEASTPFTIDFSLRVINADNAPVQYPAFQIGAVGSGLQANVEFHTVKDRGDSQVSATIATTPPWNSYGISAIVDTDFHNYHLSVVPGQEAQLYVDGTLVTQGHTVPQTGLRFTQLFFGDDARESEGFVQIRKYVFTIPESSSTLRYSFLVVVGLGLLRRPARSYSRFSQR